MSAPERLTPEREAAIREWVGRLVQPDASRGGMAVLDLLFEIDALRADLAAVMTTLALLVEDDAPLTQHDVARGQELAASLAQAAGKEGGDD